MKLQITSDTGDVLQYKFDCCLCGANVLTPLYAHKNYIADFACETCLKFEPSLLEDYVKVKKISLVSPAKKTKVTGKRRQQKHAPALPYMSPQMDAALQIVLDQEKKDAWKSFAN